MTTQEQTKAPGEAIRTSRVGKRPIEILKGVTVTLTGRTLEVKGPKGTLKRDLVDQVEVKIEAGKVTVTSSAKGSDGARLQGMTRAHINNMVKGAAEGYTETLELVGTGYRAEVKGTTLNLALGLSHPVIFVLPGDIKAVIPADSKGTLIVLTGSDKDLMGQTAAKLRSFRPPEPYGGKGVRYKGENVRRKAGKAGKGGKGGKGGKLAQTRRTNP
jgi:large subunit ribosomal protein L6